MSAKPLQRPCKIFALHGFWGAPSDFDALRAASESTNFCKWEAPHLPGHGGKPLPNSASSLEALADWTAEKLGTRSADDCCILIGYSLGARIALATAIRHPEKMSGLVLISGSPGLEHPAERKMRAATDAKRARALAACKTREHLEEFLRQWWEQPVFQSPTWKPELYERHFATRLNEDPGQLAKVLEQLSPGRQPSLWHRLSALNLPVLCIAGQEDKKFCDVAYRMQSLIAGCRVMIVPGAGHSLLLENPSSLANSLSLLLDYVCATNRF